MIEYLDATGRAAPVYACQLTTLGYSVDLGAIVNVYPLSGNYSNRLGLVIGYTGGDAACTPLVRFDRAALLCDDVTDLCLNSESGQQISLFSAIHLRVLVCAFCLYVRPLIRLSCCCCRLSYGAAKWRSRSIQPTVFLSVCMGNSLRGTRSCVYFERANSV